jgi:uncharacterized protein YceK
MKKNVLIKGILVLLIIALLTIGFSGCGTVIPPPVTTGTVYLVIGGYYWYDLYMDYTPQYYAVHWNGTYVLYNVPIGNHFFEAIDIDGSGWGYDSLYQYIYAGNNWVYLYP